MPEHRASNPQLVGRSRWAMPDPGDADPDGPLAFGADLGVETLVDAYRQGIFPWPHPDVPLPWFSPDPRGVVPVDAVRISRSLRQRLRRSGWETTVDADFDAVVSACMLRPGRDGTWITPAMRAAYGRLNRVGWVHSVEVWDGDLLVGGLYGVRIGACFTGESMFHREPDASKVALADLAARWAEAGGELIDVQMTTPHLASLGAVDRPRAEFLADLARLRDRTVCIRLDRLPVSRLVPAPSPGPAAAPGG